MKSFSFCKKFSWVILLLFFAAVWTPKPVLAVSSGDVSISISPQFPDQNQLVKISLSSYSVNFDVSEIVWTLDGKIQTRGIGKKDFSFTTGKIGTKNNISAVIKTTDGDIEKDLVVAPSSVTLIWEAANSYTPPFYKGKAGFSYQSGARITAIPNITDSSGAKISSKNLVYKWKKGGEILSDSSGYGKSSLDIPASNLADDISVDVEVSTTDSGRAATKHISIRQDDPQVLIYENNPLYGILFNKAATGDYSMKDQEMSFTAFPYSFNTYSKNSANIKYSWTMNDKSAFSSGDKSSIILRREGDAKGQSKIFVGVQNAGRILQNATANFILDFSNSGANTISF